MVLIGDIHGNFNAYRRLLGSSNAAESIQLGDFGIGFPDGKGGFTNIENLDLNHKFLRGNHDNPSLCVKHPNYMGDYGITKEGFFFIGGAYSIDHAIRTPNIDWWQDEELSYNEFMNAISLYESVKPDVVLTHAPPQELIMRTSTFKISMPSRTGNALQTMFDIHAPKIWVFAHMHIHFEQNIGNTFFKCLNIEETYKL